MRRLIAIVLSAALSLTSAAGAGVAADKIGALCVSRIYDFMRRPVDNFAIDTRRTQLITADAYARYVEALTAAAEPLGYDPASLSYTLHESLSAFPFLNRGIIREVILVLCAAGRERDNICRRADYYIYDAEIDAHRLSLMLIDILAIDAPALIDSCEFGRGQWSELD